MSEPFKELLGRAFDEHRGDLRVALSRDEYERLRHDFVFHMTDWLDDLDMLHVLRSAPESSTARDAMHALIGMLYHVPPHIKAAARLLLDRVEDPFEGNEADQLLDKAHRAEARAS